MRDTLAKMRALAPVLLAGLASFSPGLPDLLSVEHFLMRQSSATEGQPTTLLEVPPNSGEITLETTVRVTPELRRPGQPLGLYIGALASHEVFWDGTLLGRGGVVGRSAAEEVPGPIEAHYQIPDHLAAPGPHQLRIRASSFHRHFRPEVGYWGVLVGDYERIVTWRRSAALGSAMALSGLLLTAGFAVAMFGATRERASLLLGLLALSGVALLAVEVWRPLLGYPYDLHIVRLWAILILSWLTGLQLVALVVTRFPRTGGRRLLLLLAAATVLAALWAKGWDGKALAIHALSFGVALVWVLPAALERRPGSGLALLGLVAAVVILAYEPPLFLDRVFFALNLLFLCLLGSHAVEVRRVRQARARAELEASRLELEMVRRQIQPHFLMNTLTALAEWVETEPRTAVRMIEAIAEELRLLAELSGRSMVPAADELRLCRSHLLTMSLRKEVSYELEVEGLRGDELLPPAVLHTLVENAVTHGAPLPRVTLTLKGWVEGDRRRLTLDSPAASAAAPKAGTGTRYIEARLRQAWGEDWSFHQGPVAGGWRAELNMPLGAPA